ncbi:MAG: DUF998 domain-containing protein [Actinomycetaceae bacterium]|nr:DUF998 domain-containing protein [Actinomycetaceae bacterium]
MTSRPTILTIAIATAVVYSSWALAPWLNPELDAVNAFASELGADGQPNAWVFRLADVVAAIGFLTVTWLAAPRTLQIIGFSRTDQAWEHLLPHLIWGCVALLGIATIVDATFPMSCAESQVSHAVAVSSQCRTPSMLIHETASVVVGASTIGATVLSTWLFVSRQLPQRMLITALTGLHIALTAYTGLDAFLNWPGKGLTQRGSIVALVLWWVLYVAIVTKLHQRQGERT